ncbi:MAG: hypothetical protein ACTS4U_01440 [Candidatus Hodgkinia cicadicola]
MNERSFEKFTFRKMGTNLTFEMIKRNNALCMERKLKTFKVTLQFAKL